MAETITQTTILNVETSQSVKSVKDLKQQIRDLKDKIVELNAAGEDTTNEFQELGTLMRQYKDINEEAKRSSKDFGDQITTVSGGLKGVAGAISTVTGVMGLMGFESEKSTKLLKTMAAAMSITSGIQAMESGYKSIKSLINGFGIATKSVKTFGTALKSAFSSNPITLVAMALAGIISVINGIKSKAEELKNSLVGVAEAVTINLKNAIDNVTNGTLESWKVFETRMGKGLEDLTETIKNSFDFSSFYKKNVHQITVYEDKLLKGLQNSINNETKIYSDAVAQREKLIKDGAKETDDEVLKMDKTISTAQMQIFAKQAVFYKEATNELRNALKYLTPDFVGYEQAKKILDEYDEKLKQTVKNYNTQYDKLNDTNNKSNEVAIKQAEEAKKAANDRLQKAKDNAKKQLEIQKKAIEEDLKLQQTKTKRLYDLDVETATNKLRNGEISEKEYNAAILALEEKFFKDSTAQYDNYISKMQGLREQFKNNKLISKEDIDNIFPDAAFEEIQQKKDDARRKYADSQFDYNTNNKENDIAAKELQNEIDKQNALNKITKDSFEKRWEIEKEYTAKSIFGAENSWKIQAGLIQQEMEEENRRYETIKNNILSEKELLREKYDNGLISQQEFNQGMAELLQEDFDNEKENTEKKKQIEKEWAEYKKAIGQKILDASVQMNNATIQVLNGLADYLGEENEHYKGLKIAAAVLDTIGGAVTAYTSALSLGVPLGPIVGAVNAAAVTAMGLMNIAKMKQTDAKNGSGASVSATATQTFTTPQTATIATGATNDYTDMMGNAVENATAKAQQTQKVVLVLNELDDAQSRKVQVTDSNTF